MNEYTKAYSWQSDRQWMNDHIQEDFSTDCAKKITFPINYTGLQEVKYTTISKNKWDIKISSALSNN